MRIHLDNDRLAEMRFIIRKHYGLKRQPTDTEIRAEVANLVRKAGDYDGRHASLAASLEPYAPEIGAWRSNA